jgi:hypothetical protein
MCVQIQASGKVGPGRTPARVDLHEIADVMLGNEVGKW